MGERPGPIDLSEFRNLLFAFAEECLSVVYRRSETTNDVEKSRLDSDDLEMLMEEFFEDYRIMKQSWIYDDTEPFDDDPSYGYD